MHKKNAEAREAFEKETAFDFVSSHEEIFLNIGGQKYKTTAGVLCRDRFSLLACICRTEPPISKDGDGAFFFERDWWIFRYVLEFLRTGDLPQDQALLQEMYGEAAFYRLSSLRRAIQRRAATPTSAIGGTMPSGPGGTRPRAQEANATSTPRHQTSSSLSKMAHAAEGAAGTHRQQEKQLAGTQGLFREPLPDPFGFSAKGSL
eukprot:g8757.t1